MTQQFRALARPQVLTSLLTTALVFGAMFGVFTYIEPLLREVTGYPASAVPWLLVVFGFGLLAGNIVGGWAADRNADSSVLVLSILLPATTLTLGAVAGMPAPMAVLLFLLGLIGFATVPGLQARVLRHATGAATLTSATNIAAFNLDNTIGVSLAGAAIASGYGLTSPTITGAGLTVTGLLLIAAARISARHRNTAVRRSRMTWSTRQIAQIADTTVNSVRHYHKMGLLPQPERAANGYKQYGIPHLIRLFQIKRLSGLGISVSQIAVMDRHDADVPQQIRTLDADLAATINRLTRVRAELASVLSHHAPLETPRGFAALSSHLSETQRSLPSVYSTVFDGPTLEAFRRALLRREETDDEFDRLPATADDAAVEDLARRMVPATRRLQSDHPELVDPLGSSPLGPALAGLTMAHALVELYNPAQLRVLQRLDALLGHGEGDAPGPTHRETPASTEITRSR